MRVAYQWLKEYVDVNLAPRQLAEALTLAGIAVDRVEDLGINNVVVGEILDVAGHPNSDHLQVCLVRVEEGKEPLSIVTGAPNVRVGQRVAVAVEGAELPGGQTITTTNFRGVVSQGMLCSAQELGLDLTDLPDEQLHGILDLPQGSPVGAKVDQIFGIADQVLELDLTPNRADCLAMVNVAREVAAVTGGHLHLPEISLKPEARNAADMTSVDIEATDLCGRYVAKIIENVKIGPSPQWMQKRLLAAGVRPINNIVDITNYVMLEMGQPLHAFDYHTLEGRRIIVRRGRPGESIVSLDKVTRQLDPEMLVIADAVRPVAIAGVMGGLDTEITASTTTVLLESAHFDGASIRRTSRQLGLRSEASMRFEKGVDINGTVAAADRAAQLMADWAGGRVAAGEVDAYVRPWTPPVITLRMRRVNEILGTALTMEQILEVLRRLHLEVRVKEEHSLEVTVPSYRGDLTTEIDLIEEVARIHGYHLIPTTLPGGATGRSKKTAAQRLEEICREVLAYAGLNEVITYSFVNPAVFDRLTLPSGHPWRDTVAIKNPLSEDQSVMRTTLLPGLLEVAARNVNRRATSLALFELGRIFLPREGGEGGLPRERLVAAGLATGWVDRGWQQKPLLMDYYYLKGIVEELFARLGLQGYRFMPVGDFPGLHPGRTAEIQVDGENLGFIGELHPEVQENYDLPERTCVFQLDFETMQSLLKGLKQYVPLPKFPAVTRDMAIVVSVEVPAAEIGQTIQATGGELLRHYRLFDVYQGAQISAGKKSLAYTMVYQSAERTLTDEDVHVVHRRILQVLADRYGAELR
ncbi:phenylalanyl-tRNA synthetase subunit beta [Clostridiales bacterium PH28_bin88]|nr:phenylalanyl-tRNA synthetase subunit beta [Clostridiales bacterium PH28_bin88]